MNEALNTNSKHQIPTIEERSMYYTLAFSARNPKVLRSLNKSINRVNGSIQITPRANKKHIPVKVR